MGKNDDPNLCIWDRMTMVNKTARGHDTDSQASPQDTWYIPRCNRETFHYLPAEGSIHHFTFCPNCGKPFELRPKAK